MHPAIKFQYFEIPNQKHRAFEVIKMPLSTENAVFLRLEKSFHGNE